ncbi:DNA-directed RNA polymerase [Candidatus Woesearchaeota archaeon]|nr:MAG: DNA-directed RNA polymerase [Candidatus Woesearchaeota archaeon]
MRRENNRNRGDSRRGEGFDKQFGGSNRHFNNVQREMHKATCSDCKQECEVPFRPTEGKPVYCRNCFSKHREDRF